MSRGSWPGWRPILVAAGAAVVVAGLGTAATDLGPWYQELRKPPWQPPDWLFGPAWTLIYALTALAGAMAWQAARTGRERRRILGLFGLNAGLNVLWSWLYFTWQRPGWALAEAVLLWLSIVLLIKGIAPLSRRAGWLLLPYLLWVSFATVLNLAIVLLNAPGLPA